MSEEASDSRSFGPSAILTPANALTLLRLLGAPVIIVLVLTTGPASWLTWALWSVLTLSDVADGHIARRHGVTRSGAFLDPLADKFLVLGAFAALVARGVVSWVPVVIIAIREVAMNIFRVRSGRRGISVPASSHAKFKTLFQDLAIGAAFFPPIGAHFHSVVTTLVWLAVLLTVVTGLEYARDARGTMRSHAASSSLAGEQRSS